jgi:uncharacterized membrane protein SirB2
MDQLGALEASVEMLLHFFVFFGAIGVLVLVAMEAEVYSRKSEYYTAAFALQAALVGGLVIYMGVQVVLNGRFYVTNAAVAWEVAVIALVLALVFTVYVVMRMSVLKGVDETAARTSSTIVDGVTTLSVRPSRTSAGSDVRRRVVFVKSDDNSAAGGFSFSVWLGLRRMQDVFQGKTGGRVRVPLLIKGIPFRWYVSGYTHPHALVKSPAIFLVLERDKAPFFEVEFNHIQPDDTPIQGDTPRNECIYLDPFTAKCAFFRDSPYMDMKGALVAGAPDDPDRLHHVAFVFSEEYINTSFTAARNQLYTRLSIYVDGDVKQSNYFRGQMKTSSNYIMPLPQALLEVTNESGARVPPDAGITTFLASSSMADLRFFSYPLNPGEVKGLLAEGHNTYTEGPAAATVAATTPPDGPYLTTTTFDGIM